MNPNSENRIKDFIQKIGWRMFIWGLGMTEEDYWADIYTQEKMFRKTSKDKPTV